MLAQIDLVIECRDYRIPFTSRNPLLEDGLKGKDRIIVYTKYDLGHEAENRSMVTMPLSLRTAFLSHSFPFAQLLLQHAWLVADDWAGSLLQRPATTLACPDNGAFLRHDRQPKIGRISNLEPEEIRQR